MDTANKSVVLSSVAEAEAHAEKKVPARGTTRSPILLSDANNISEVDAQLGLLSNVCPFEISSLPATGHCTADSNHDEHQLAFGPGRLLANQAPMAVSAEFPAGGDCTTNTSAASLAHPGLNHGSLCSTEQY